MKAINFKVILVTLLVIAVTAFAEISISAEPLNSASNPDKAKQVSDNMWTATLN